LYILRRSNYFRKSFTKFFKKIRRNAEKRIDKPVSFL